MDTWQEKITNDMQKGRKAQEEGKHGLARVCARRAAGWAIQENLARNGIDLSTRSAFEYIQYQASQSGNPPRLQQSLEYMMRKMEKDSLEEDAYWPLPEVDLLSEAEWLIKELLDFNI